MRISGAKKIHYDSGPNMTPLVDVVMVILIFLMLAGSFGSAERYMASSVPIHPSGGGGTPPPPGWTPPTMVDIKVGPTGEARLPDSNEPLTDPAEVTEALKQKLLQFKANGEDVKNIECVLRPVEGTKWEALAPLYGAAMKADFQKISFAMAGGK